MLKKTQALNNMGKSEGSSERQW